MRINNSIKTIGKVCSAILAVLGFVLSGIAYLHDSGGTLQAVLNGEVLENHSRREVIVCLDKPQTVSSMSLIYPTFSNTSSYSIRDFYLSYHIESSSVMFEPTDYFTLHNDGPGKYTLKYNENVLPGSRSVENPIREIVVAENGGDMKYISDVTYDGSSEPYIYELNAKYIVVPMDEGMSYEQWKHKCQKQYLAQNGAKETAVLYQTSKGNIEYAMSIALTANNETHAVQQEPVQQKPVIQEKIVQQKTVQQKPVYKDTLPSVGTKKQNAVTTRTTIEKNNIVSVSQTRNIDNSVWFTFNFNHLQSDTTFVVCTLHEDTLKHERRNLLRVMPVKCDMPTYKFSTYSQYTLQEYVFCTENPALKDSVRLFSEGIYNKTRHTIAIRSLDKDRDCLVPPHQFAYLDSAENLRLAYYDVPQQILTGEYTPITKRIHDVEQIVKDSLLLALKFALIPYVILLLIAPIVRAIDENNFSKEDILWYVKDLWSIRFDFLKLSILIYLGAAGLMIIFSFMAQLVNYYDIFH